MLGGVDGLSLGFRVRAGNVHAYTHSRYLFPLGGNLQPGVLLLCPEVFSSKFRTTQMWSRRCCSARTNHPPFLGLLYDTYHYHCIWNFFANGRAVLVARGLLGLGKLCGL